MSISQSVAVHELAPPEHEPAPPMSGFETLHCVVGECIRQREMFESRVGFDTLVGVMSEMVPSAFVTAAIDTYRTVIRRNLWMFPTIEGPLAEVQQFLAIWTRVHVVYHEVAQKIFLRLKEGGLEALADVDLYQAVVHSETSRGWVGKRSPIGPDAQIEKRSSTVEALLNGLLSDIRIDRLLDVGGALPGVGILRSAEEDLTELLAILSDPDSPRGADARIRALRDYAKYDVRDLANKVGSAAGPLVRVPTSTRGVTGGDLPHIPVQARAEVMELLHEIQMLNFLNLNLEPRFSFKSWAGLMHALVFATVRALPGMSDDVYHNLSTLKGQGK